MVGGGMVGGGVVGGIVGGTKTVVGGSVIVLVGGAVVSGGGGGGGSVVAVVVCTGGEVVPGETVPVPRGAVVNTEGWVVAVVPPGPGAAGTVVEDVPTEVDVELDEELDVDGPLAVEEVGRAMVEVGDWLATCCLGDVSPPVVTSNKRAVRATDARAYSPTLKR